MKKWMLSQLTEPTAWLCFAFIISVILMPDWFSILLALIGIAIDEAAMKAWCAKVAPGIAAKIDEWTK